VTGFKLTNKAKFDLKEIAIYTQNIWGKRQRNIYLTMLDKSFYDLSTNHQIGRECNEIRIDYRIYRVGKHMIFYREINTSLIEIVRILHEQMDIESHL
jgi:Plasmid stabilization system protein